MTMTVPTATTPREAAATLLVRTPDAKLVSLAVDGATLVADLKARAAAETGLRAADTYLLYQSKPLRDRAELAMYGLGQREQQPADHLPEVALCVRQPGGCFIVTFTILTILFFATICAPLTCGTSLLLYIFLLPPVFVLPFFCL